MPEECRESAALFRTRFQQLTGPLMAKSVEDTLFFRHNLELALNEVGADPTPRAFSLSRFHQEMRIRLARQPDALLGTSTHDTKRGEDARARLYTLTEAPEQWGENLARWRQMNQTQVRFLNDGTAPNAADTWMIYQALAGVWPATLSPDDADRLASLEARFIAFLEKALRRRNSAQTGSTATRAMRAWCCAMPGTCFHLTTRCFCMISASPCGPLSAPD